MGLESSLFWWQWRLSPTPVDNLASVGKGFATCQTGLSLHEERFSTVFRNCPQVFPGLEGGHPQVVHGLSTRLWEVSEGQGVDQDVGMINWVWRRSEKDFVG